MRFSFDMGHVEWHNFFCYVIDSLCTSDGIHAKEVVVPAAMVGNLFNFHQCPNSHHGTSHRIQDDETYDSFNFGVCGLLPI
jgi:hypothetical protein